MLSIGKLTGGADSARYYEQSVASGREDYYSGRGESAGQWIGDGALALGIEGNVSEGELPALLVDTRHPVTGELLRAVGGTTVQGFDLTFSAPKSVSVLLAVADESVRAAVVRAHETAVRDALDYLEREAVQVRRGKGGAVKEHAGGLVAAAYRHRTSRAGDPQLHTHVVAANLAQGADGRWTALHGAALYTHAKTAGYLYQAALRDQLARTLGLHWDRVVNGTAEIQGMPPGVLAHFSQRRAEIVEAMAHQGVTSARAAQVAALATRRAKTYGVDVSNVYERWQARAAEHGLTPQIVADVLGREPRLFGHDQMQAVAAFMAGEAGLTAHASTFTRREAIQAWAELHPDGANVARIEELADRWLTSDLVVRIDSEHAPVGRHQVVRTRAGTRVADIEDRYTTPDMLEAEQRLIDNSAARADTSIGLAGTTAIETALAARPYLADEQQSMVRALTTSGDGVQIVLAKAGAGKTTALDAAREAWARSGLIVQGTALGSYATKELRDAGVPATTIAGLLIDIQRGDGLPRGSVLIVDEAGMVGTRTLAALADHAHRVRAKLVLVGDDKQLPEMDAGGGFRGLADRLGAIELHDNRRQQDAEDRRALDAYRAGHPDELVRSLRRRGRISVAPDVEQTRQALVADWWDGAQAEGIENVAMIALRRSEVRELNQLARARMREAGQLPAHELRIDDRGFALGDRIVTRTNAPRLGVVNGSRATIIAIHQDHSLAIRLDDGAQALLPESYVTGRRGHTPNLDHGYAITANGIQGGTVQRSYVLAGEDAYHEWGYVAASRHRVETRFYVTVPDAADRNPADEVDPLADLARAFGRSRAQQLAIDVAAEGALHTLPDDHLDIEATRLRELTKTAPSSAHNLDHIDADRVRVLEELRRSRDQLQATTSRITSVPRRDRRLLKHRRASEEQAIETWQRRLDGLDDERAMAITRDGDPDRWIAHHKGDVARLVAVERELHRRGEIQRRETIRVNAAAPPAYITEVLGSRPLNDLRRQRAWDRGARIIVSYRQRHGMSTASTQQGLGPRPTDRAVQHAYFAAIRRIESINAELGRDPTPAAHTSRAPDR